MSSTLKLQEKLQVTRNQQQATYKNPAPKSTKESNKKQNSTITKSRPEIFGGRQHGISEPLNH
jgi:hypothetical protein